MRQNVDDFGSDSNMMKRARLKLDPVTIYNNT